MNVVAVRGVVFPGLLVLVYACIFLPQWTYYQGDPHGPVYARRRYPLGTKYLSYLDDYHMSVYEPMAAVLVAGIAIHLLAIAQAIFSVVPVKSKRGRDIVHLFLAIAVFVLHLTAIIYTASAKLLAMGWAFYVVSVAGSIVAVANCVVAAYILKSEE